MKGKMKTFSHQRKSCDNLSPTELYPKKCSRHKDMPHVGDGGLRARPARRTRCCTPASGSICWRETQQSTHLISKMKLLPFSNANDYVLLCREADIARALLFPRSCWDCDSACLLSIQKERCSRYVCFKNTWFCTSYFVSFLHTELHQIPFTHILDYSLRTNC